MDGFAQADAVRSILSQEERYAQQRSRTYYNIRANLLQSQIKNRPNASRGTTDRRKTYLHMRCHLLKDKLSSSAAETAIAMVQSFDREGVGLPISRSSTSDSLESVTLDRNSRSTSKDSLQPLRAYGEAPYLFQPPFLLSQHAKAVTVLRWAHDSKDYLAWGCADGFVSVCPQTRDAFPQIYTLKGHQLGINDLCFSQSNDLLVSGANSLLHSSCCCH